MSISYSEANTYASDHGRYRFLSVLGQGSFGTVFHTKDNTENEEEVAIKIVKVKKSVLELLLRRKVQSLDDAKQEVDMLVQLQHENIVALKHFYEFKEHISVIGIAMVMEFCTNGNLQVYLGKTAQNEERLETSLKVQWYKQLSNALQFIHLKGIVHRDLKPPNILLDASDNIKVADVGLAKTVWDVKSHCNEMPQDVTFHQYMSSTTGTPAYMAPEVWDEHYQMSSDIYSLCLIFVMMAEVPNPPIPCASWESNNNCLGLLMHKNPQSRYVLPTDLFVPLIKRVSNVEVKLFNDMLQYDYHKRPTITQVIKRVQEIEKVALQKTRSLEEETARCTIL